MGTKKILYKRLCKFCKNYVSVGGGSSEHKCSVKKHKQIDWGAKFD